MQQQKEFEQFERTSADEDVDSANMSDGACHSIASEQPEFHCGNSSSDSESDGTASKLEFESILGGISDDDIGDVASGIDCPEKVEIILLNCFLVHNGDLLCQYKKWISQLQKENRDLLVSNWKLQKLAFTNVRSRRSRQSVSTRI